MYWVFLCFQCDSMMWEIDFSDQDTIVLMVSLFLTSMMWGRILLTPLVKQHDFIINQFLCLNRNLWFFVWNIRSFPITYMLTDATRNDSIDYLFVNEAYYLMAICFCQTTEKNNEGNLDWYYNGYLQRYVRSIGFSNVYFSFVV